LIAAEFRGCAAVGLTVADDAFCDLRRSAGATALLTAGSAH
jgi:hypothetical protein